MENFLSVYQHLPLYINPIAFRIGIFSIHWYSLMYLAAFLTVYLLLMYRIKKKEGEYDKSFIFDFLVYAIIGLLIGARLGYVLFYNLSYYFSHPLEIILPIRATGFGIYGMSYFGGVIGIILVSLIFAKRKKINFWQLADFVVPAIPVGYFFGRIGNFLNGELYGRITQKPWGMYFPLDPTGLLRHPSQLYEAFFEGLVIFAILWSFRNLKTSDVQIDRRFKDIRCPNGSLLLLYLFLYGLSRFFIEFFREPDPQIGLAFGFLTLGQILSSLLMVVAIAIYFLKKNTFRTVDNCGA